VLTHGRPPLVLLRLVLAATDGGADVDNEAVPTFRKCAPRRSDPGHPGAGRTPDAAFRTVGTAASDTEDTETAKSPTAIKITECAALPLR
jgi:hypothetical protein